MITIVAVNFLFSRNTKDEASMLAPTALRTKFEQLPKGGIRTEVLDIADQLDTLAGDYDAATEAAMNAYIEDVAQWDSSADALLEVLQPLDRRRDNTLPQLIQLRQHLVDTLSPEEWDDVFG
jgi:hypothetical protein